MSNPATEAIIEGFTGALDGADMVDTPYRHWFLSGLFPDNVVEELQRIDFPVAAPGDISGKRELHNNTRHYFDQKNIATLPVADTVASAFQAPKMIGAIEDFFKTDLAGTYLRLEFAQDVTGFWLEPHTDLGVKRITVLIYLSGDGRHGDLGTDIYGPDKKWAKRTPFAPNTAMAFVPGATTYHGFEKREISGVRKSLILNYVTDEWRDREQLAFPQEAIRSR